MVELIDLQRKDDILSNMARTTSGIFVIYDDTSELLDEIESISMVSTAENIVTAVYLNRNPVWLIILLIFLTAEWLIRKKFALP